MFMRLLTSIRHNFQRVAALSAVVLTIALLLQGAGFSYAAPASNSTSKPSAQGTTPFLTLPFEPSTEMNILSGWYYSSSGGLHNGIDYISGGLKSPKTWKTFPVLASADGEACGNCSGRQGNAVWIKHIVGGTTYYSYYGHLASISPDVPLGSQSRTLKVKRGQFLGMAGNTGSDVIHLHFALYTSSSQPLDPYGIGKLREAYPAPHAGQPGIGWFLSAAPQTGTGGNEQQPAPPDAPSSPESPKSDHDDSEELQGTTGGGDAQSTRGYIGADFDHLAY